MDKYVVMYYYNGILYSNEYEHIIYNPKAGTNLVNIVFCERRLKQSVQIVLFHLYKIQFLEGNITCFMVQIPITVEGKGSVWEGNKGVWAATSALPLGWAELDGCIHWTFTELYHSLNNIIMCMLSYINVILKHKSVLKTVGMHIIGIFGVTGS